MKNKKGGFGAKLVLVLILMLASAAGGAYAYRVFDGKIAVRDALKAVEDVDVTDYDAPEQITIKGYIDDATKDLQKAKTRKEVYEVLGEFVSNVEKVKTSNQKALEEALKEAEEAKRQANNNNNNNSNTGSNNNSGNYNNGSNDSDTYDTDNGNNDSNSNSNSNNNSGGGSYKSNTLKEGSDGTEENEGNSILDSLLGSMSGK